MPPEGPEDPSVCQQCRQATSLGALHDGLTYNDNCFIVPLNV